MSAPLEMAANAVPAPPPPAQHRSEDALRERGADVPNSAAVTDAAAVRVQRVSMAAEPLSTAPEDRTDSNPTSIDIYV